MISNLKPYYEVLISSITCEVSDMKYQVSDTKYWVSDIEYWISTWSSIIYQVWNVLVVQLVWVGQVKNLKQRSSSKVVKLFK